jgi:hypothetical protein
MSAATGMFQLMAFLPLISEETAGAAFNQGKTKIAKAG